MNALEREPSEGVHADLSLLESGLLDSQSTLLLAVWIEAQIGRDIDLDDLDLATVWDTPALIAGFIERAR